MYKNLAAWRAFAPALAALFFSPLVVHAQAVKPPVKAAFVYVAPLTEAGWVRQHELGRQAVQAALGDRVETRYVENVAEGRIDAEAERPRIQFEVLAEEHRHRLAVAFHFANQPVGPFGIRRDDGAQGFVGGVWMLWRNQTRERRIEVILLEKSCEQGA